MSDRSLLHFLVRSVLSTCCAVCDAATVGVRRAPPTRREASAGGSVGAVEDQWTPE